MPTNQWRPWVRVELLKHVNASHHPCRVCPGVIKTVRCPIWQNVFLPNSPGTWTQGLRALRCRRSTLPHLHPSQCLHHSPAETAAWRIRRALQGGGREGQGGMGVCGEWGQGRGGKAGQEGGEEESKGGRAMQGGGEGERGVLTGKAAAITRQRPQTSQPILWLARQQAFTRTGCSSEKQVAYCNPTPYLHK